MKKLKVTVKFVELAIALKIAFFRNVILKMKASLDLFPKPDEDLETANALVDKLEAAQLAASDGSHQAIVNMRAIEAQTDDVFRTLAAYVDRIAKGDEVIIVASGFEPSKQPEAHNKETLVAARGSKSGSVKLTAKAVKGARSYVWQMAKGPIPTEESGWISCGYSSQANIEVENLDYAGVYNFRMAVITIDGLSDFCNPVTKLIE